MRGKVEWVSKNMDDLGITPAYAGKSLRLFRRKRKIGDHPRLCGEKRPVRLVFYSIAGSPPPMRGKVQGGDLRVLRVGITPAYAGKRDLCLI